MNYYNGHLSDNSDTFQTFIGQFEINTEDTTKMARVINNLIKKGYFIKPKGSKE